MHSRAAGSDDALLEADHALGASFFLRTAGGFLHFQMMGIEKVAVAAHHVHLAHLGHAAEPGGELADHARFVCAQAIDVDFRRGKADAQRIGMRGLIDYCGNMQQGLGGNAADIQADAAEGGIALDQHGLQTQVGGTECGGITARSGAEHQHFAFDVGLAGEAGGCGGCDGRCNGRRSRRRNRCRARLFRRHRRVTTADFFGHRLCLARRHIHRSHHSHQGALRNLVAHFDFHCADHTRHR